VMNVYADIEEISRAAAGLFASLSERAIAEHGRFDVALSGGGTPRRTYELLAEPSYRDAVDWGFVHVFWGDERCVPADDELSNARAAYEALIERVPLPRANIHPIPCSDGEHAPEAARSYERILRDHFGGQDPPPWDLVFLGLGADGHTASLLPGSPQLVEPERWVTDSEPPEEGPRRVTLTPLAIRSAETVVFLVSGAEKAGALRNARTAPFDPTRWPAHAVRPRSGDLIWLVDAAAAGGLSRLKSGLEGT
jgi:6-phosphogluconolactonase